jgi:hypothetical protein
VSAVSPDSSKENRLNEVRQLTRTLLTAFQFANPEDEHPEDQVWRQVVFGLSGNQGRLLPQAMADCLVALDGLSDDDRVALALRLASGLDLVEMVGAAVYVARNRGSYGALMTAAALSQNPGAAPGFRESINDLISEVCQSNIQEEVIRVLLDPAYAPSVSGVKRVRSARWPGVDPALAPPQVALLMGDAAPTGGAALLSGELLARGVSVRRVYPLRDPTYDLEPWLSSRTVRVGWGGADSNRKDEYYIIPVEFFDSDDLSRVLDTLSHAFQAKGYTNLGLTGPPLMFVGHQERSAAAERSGQTFDLQWSKYLSRLKAVTFRATINILMAAAATEIVTYESLLQSSAAKAFTSSEPFLADSSSWNRTVDEVIERSVGAAVSELMKQGLVMWHTQDEILQRVA